eukprot:16443627-Heterocapsa_arctica.AAC.1
MHELDPSGSKLGCYPGPNCGKQTVGQQRPSQHYNRSCRRSSRHCCAQEGRKIAAARREGPTNSHSA